MTVDDRLKKIGIKLPLLPEPTGTFVHAVKTGNLLFLGGKAPRNDDGKFSIGKLGRNMSVEQGYSDARNVGILLLAVMKKELGNLDRVKRIIKILGMVNATPEFEDHTKVINGCSDLFVEVFGEKGRHSRSAVGMGSLPNQITVEIEAVIEFE
ncbi:RidA family protein [Patescibacteria group bacterium]|nr:RidA family protein [Patescibacteria group bacterium]